MYSHNLMGMPHNKWQHHLCCSLICMHLYIDTINLKTNQKRLIVVAQLTNGSEPPCHACPLHHTPFATHPSSTLKVPYKSLYQIFVKTYVSSLSESMLKSTSNPMSDPTADSTSNSLKGWFLRGHMPR